MVIGTKVVSPGVPEFPVKSGFSSEFCAALTAAACS